MKKYLLFCLIGLLSCNKVTEDIKQTDYDPEFAIPVITDASVSFTELWQNDSPGQSLVIRPDGGLVFKYESEPVQVTTLDILGELDFPIITGLQDTITTLPFELPANILIEEATIDGGTLLFQFRPVSQVPEVIFTLPQIKRDGVPLVVTTSGGAGATIPMSLQGYSFEPTSNELTIEYSAKDTEGNHVPLSNAGIITRPRLKFVKGTWGREEFKLTPAIIPIDLYDDRFLNGNLRFTEPTITANIESSFGVPIRSRIDILNAWTKTGFPMTIDASAIDGIDINYPLLVERGVSKKTVLQLDYTNSNIVEVFDAQLTELEYGITAIANPEDDQDLTVFIEDTSTFKAQVIVEVPVIGSTKNFVATEEFDVPFEDIETITEGEFKLIVENELPIGAQLQFYFLDANQLIIDSLFQTIPQLVEASAIDDNGQVTAASETTTYIPIATNQMQNIIEAQQIRVKATFQTAENGLREVAIKADQTINFRMGLKFKIN